MNWNSEQIRQDAQNRRRELHARLAQIPIEKKKLEDEVQAIKRELIGLDQVLDGLDVMTSGPVPTPDPAGFTDKIRKLLSETSIPLVPTQIRDALEQSGVSASSPKNLLISVHTVLERIDDELEKFKRSSDGKIAYKRKVPWDSTNIVWNSILEGLLNPATQKVVDGILPQTSNGLAARAGLTTPPQPKEKLHKVLRGEKD